MKNRKRYSIILVPLIVIIISCFVLYMKVSHMVGPAFVLISGYTSKFYKTLLMMVIVAAFIGILYIRMIIGESHI